MGVLPEDPAGQMALLTVVVAAIWKIWFRMRADHRGDRIAIVDKDAHENIADGYGKLVEQLRAEVDRLARMVTELSQSLDDERLARRQAQQAAAELLARVAQLERQLRDLGHPI